MKKIVLALGGNALGNTPEEQKEAVKNTAKSIVDLVEQGNKVIISHGNGPQVGMINLAMDAASKSDAKTPQMPFPECGAMSQGYIGYHLQNSIENELKRRNMDVMTATIVTQVLVDKEDKAFDNPTKPVGAFYTKEQAEEMEKKGFKFKEDAGRGYRRVVPSPKPIDIVEKQAVETLYNANCIVIAAGGGGIPVIKENDELVGVPAVIDKDFTTAKLAELVDADTLIILTAVEKVAIRFGKPDEQWLDKLTVEEALIHIENKEFAEGSMKPKVEAAINFAKSKAGRTTLITSLEKAAEGLEGKTGTLISL
ncbi:carbamate kinase [Peptoanaerobacter stomatis]|uniref:Carbamate kinase n=1 Tax=Peptoanaerobacter stomatis TaxID=796937 RepID=J6H876_9FIRM|nr:carbamate kinase [Peptoanaerobacter stomatis]EJU21430.1 carbamate kinase [Peptoanaerobacter stomatis]NWO24706.1 carbamate kinase [Peptostreptococcaceae bacterium oral taxon 081]